MDTGYHEAFMDLALEEARKALEEGEVPIGAVLILEGEVVASAHNRTISLCDPTAHAEVLAIREGAKRIGNWRLVGSDLYVTLEPCVMCAGAIVQARIRRLVFGTRDPKAGALTLYGILADGRLNHRPEIVEGVRAQEARDLLQGFFRQLRAGEVPKWS